MNKRLKQIKKKRIKQIRNFYQMYKRAKAAYKKKNGNAQKGKKIRETRELGATLLKQFPLGSFVSIKYCTKSIGIVAQKPIIKRYVHFNYELRKFVDVLHASIPVLWMSGVEFVGEMYEFPPDSLKKPNMKKVLEIQKQL